MANYNIIKDEKGAHFFDTQSKGTLSMHYRLVYLALLSSFVVHRVEHLARTPLCDCSFLLWLTTPVVCWWRFFFWLCSSFSSSSLLSLTDWLALLLLLFLVCLIFLVFSHCTPFSLFLLLMLTSFRLLCVCVCVCVSSSPLTFSVCSWLTGWLGDCYYFYTVQRKIKLFFS